MSAEILSILLAANLAASAAILVVVSIRKTARRIMGARLAYWLWLAPVLAGLATLLPARVVETVAAPAAPVQPVVEAAAGIVGSGIKPEGVAGAPVAIDIALLLAGVWFAGVLFFLGLVLLQQRRALRALELARDNGAVAKFGPAVVGVLKPYLVVPADFQQRFSPTEQHLVLAHEGVHLEGQHTRINAVLVVLTSLNWFNPLVHWAARLSRDDQELACDATVLERFPRDRGSYAEALLKTQISAQPLPLGCTWPSRSSHFFKERMSMLANTTPSRTRRMAGAGFVVAALLGAGLAAWAQKPPVPAFASVSVDKLGNVTWEGKAVDAAAMAAQARTQAASSAPNIQITADPATPFNETVKVMEAAQKAGMRAIKVMPSGVVLDTPQPPPPGLPPPGMAPPRPAPAVSNVAIIERMKPDPTATPKSTAPPVPVPYPIPDPVRVFVDFDGGVFVNGVWQSPADLEKAFKGFAAMKTQPEIHIEVHARTTYARVEQVIAMADKAGLRLFGLVQDII